jgi:hypothetical protein
MNEFIATQHEHSMEPGEGEENVEHRVVRDPHLLFAFVEEITEDRAVEGDPQIRDGFFIEFGRAFVVAAVAEAHGHRPSYLFDQIADQLAELFEDRRRPAFEELQGRLEVRHPEFGREVVPAAVDQVVGLVDHQHRILQRVAMQQAAQPDGGVEDVVVVADDEVDLREEIETDLERADHVFSGGFEYAIRVLVLGFGDQRRQQLGADQLETVLLGVGAKLFVADDLGVGAHLGFGAQLEAPEETLLHGPRGFDRESLLERLGGEEKNPLPAPERGADHGMQNGCGLAATGWRPDQQMAAVVEGVGDGVADLLL